MRPASRNQRQSRSGVVLIAVLIVTVLLSLSAFQFSELMLQEYAAAESSLKSIQAHALADSGVYQAAAMLADKDTMAGTLANNPYDAESAFSAVQIAGGSDGKLTGRFSIFAPVPSDLGGGSQAFRYGVTDETGRLNINALVVMDPQKAHDALMKLPDMTEEIADAIVDWIDKDDEPRAGGAETSYYQGLSPPYRAKNGPLDSIEELLLVRGVTPALLFGSDYNRNGVQDASEGDTSTWLPGWASYLTVYSREQNVDIDRNPRTFLNNSDLKTLHDSLTTVLGQQLADFIILYRTQTAGSSTNGGSGSGGSSSQPTPAPVTMNAAVQSGPGGTFTLVLSAGKSSGSGQNNSPTLPASSQQISDKLNQVLGSTSSNPKSISSRYELIDASVTWTIGSGRNQLTVRVDSPLKSSDSAGMEQSLPLLLDKTTTQNQSELPARVNVLTAPAEVLTCLTGITTQLTDADVQAIIAARPSPADATDLAHQTPAWLVSDAKLSIAKVQALERYVTSRTQVYRVQSVGYFDQGGPSARVEAVIDTNGGKPRIVMWRDLSELGKGLDVTQQQ